MSPGCGNWTGSPRPHRDSGPCRAPRRAPRPRAAPANAPRPRLASVTQLPIGYGITSGGTRPSILRITKNSACRAAPARARPKTTSGPDRRVSPTSRMTRARRVMSYSREDLVRTLGRVQASDELPRRRRPTVVPGRGTEEDRLARHPIRRRSVELRDRGPGVAGAPDQPPLELDPQLVRSPCRDRQLFRIDPFHARRVLLSMAPSCRSGESRGLMCGWCGAGTRDPSGRARSRRRGRA